METLGPHAYAGEAKETPFNFLASLINGNVKLGNTNSIALPSTFNFLASLINGNAAEEEEAAAVKPFF